MVTTAANRFDQPLIRILEAKNEPYSSQLLPKLKRIISTQTYSNFSPKATLTKLKGIAQKFEFHSQNAKLKLMKRMIERLEGDLSEVALKCCWVFLELSEKPLEQDLLLIDVANYKDITLDLDESSEEAPFTGEHWQTEKFNYEDSEESLSSEEYENDGDLNDRGLTTRQPQINRYVSNPVDLNGWDDPNNLYWKRPGRDQGQGLVKIFATEYDLIREVLFQFTGTTSTIFKIENGVFVYDHKYSLKHLSDPTLISLMTKFANLSNEIESVSNYVNLNNFNSSILEAFQAGVMDILTETKTKFIDLEMKLRKRIRENQELYIPINEDDGKQDFANSLDTISLIWMYQKLERISLPVKIALSIITALDSVKDEIIGVKSCFLLNFLYDAVCREQVLDREVELQTYLELFIKSAMPLMRTIGALFSSGVGATLGNNEFFLQINSDSLRSSGSRVGQLDWATCCSTIPEHCPSFLKSFLEQFLRALKSCLMMDVWFDSAKDIPALLHKSYFSVPEPSASIEVEPAIDNCLLGKNEGKGDVHIKLVHISDSLEPFECSFQSKLEDLLRPTLDYADIKMKSFLLQDYKVQDGIMGFQQLCFFLYGGITISFCDRVLQLPSNKLKNRWKIQKCLIDSACDGELGLDLDLLEIVVIESDSSLPFDVFEISYKAPWPLNQLLSTSTQKRYNGIFKLLALIYQSNKLVHLSKLNTSKTTEKLYLSSFISSLGSFFMNSVVEPLSKRDWDECSNLDELFEMHESMLSEIEFRLYLKHSGLNKALIEMILNCHKGVYDHDLALFLHDAMVVDGQDWYFPLLPEKQ